MNPRLPPYQARTDGSRDSLCEDGLHCGESEAVNWQAFREWLYKEFRPKTAYGRFQYARQYYQCLLEKDFKPLLELSQDKRAHVMNSLSALSKFLGMHEEFLRLVKNYGLKWQVKSDDIVIARFTKSVDANEVFDWIKLVKISLPELRDFMDFMTATGLRFEEAIESYNLIIKLSSKGKLGEYYNIDREVLEHFRFKETFLRKTKKAFISFVPKELVEKIRDNKPLTVNIIQKRIQRTLGKLRFGDIREVHATLLTKHLNEVEINFLHGRVSSSVFMRNYFNPVWISDLKERVFKAIEQLMQRIS
ncbi:MAG: integrase [Candidatus Bathyarchaeia archaeon]